MCRRAVLHSVAFVLLSGALVAQESLPTWLATFENRLGGYVEMHRRLEGPIPPLAVTSDMDEVHRLMAALRGRITGERKMRGEDQGYLLSAEVVQAVRGRIAGCLSPDDIADVMADVDEHSPSGMPFPRVNEPLPDAAPFGMIPPQALKVLPRLPPELRWVVLAKALLIWDHHAALVVDLAPGVFDASTYRKIKSNDNEGPVATGPREGC